jgi:hypothetical protein
MNDEVFGFANADVAEVQNNLEALANGLVKILHGSADGVHPVAGYTVGAVRASLASSYNIQAGAMAMIGGQQVGDDHILAQNDTLEFIQPAGEKG